MNSHIEIPLVSVILPSYRHRKYLKERIESILSQDYPNFELIMLEDKSDDGSAEVMLGYKDNPHVSKILIREQNTGNTFIQWRDGIEMAKGEYIWIAESDDVAKPYFLSSLMRKIQDNDAVIGFSYSSLIDQDGNLIPKDPNRRWLYKDNGVYDGKAFVEHRLSLTTIIFNASMAVWKRSCFENVSREFMKYRHCGDWLFWFEICRQGRVVEIPECLNMFRQHPQKVTKHAEKSGDNFREIAPIQLYILDALKATDYQRRVVRGRLSKRLWKSAPSAVRNELKIQYPTIYNASVLDMLCYVFDKKTNLSGYQYSK